MNRLLTHREVLKRADVWPVELPKGLYKETYKLPKTIYRYKCIWNKYFTLEQVAKSLKHGDFNGQRHYIRALARSGGLLLDGLIIYKGCLIDGTHRILASYLIWKGNSNPFSVRCYEWVKRK